MHLNALPRFIIRNIFSKRIKTLLLAMFLPIFFSAFILKESKAQEDSINLTLSPTSIYMETDPGVQKTYDIKVRNNGTTAEKLKITLGKFIADETGEKPKLLDISENDMSIDWVSFDKNSFEVAPGEWETIKAIFNPPDTASLSYFYAIYVSRESPVVELGKANLIGSPAILMLTTVNSPNSRRELILEKFSADYGFLEFLPQNFDAHIKNSGNVSIIPYGNIFIDSSTTKNLAVINLNPNSNTILPDSSRSYKMSWDQGFPFYKKDPNTQSKTLEWNFDDVKKLRFGRYTANIIVVFDNGERDIPIESTITFWVIPVRIILFAIAVPLVPSLLVYFLMRRRFRKLNQVQ
jgi:hypothetical protein